MIHLVACRFLLWVFSPPVECYSRVRGQLYMRLNVCTWAAYMRLIYRCLTSLCRSPVSTPSRTHPPLNLERYVWSGGLSVFISRHCACSPLGNSHLGHASSRERARACSRVSAHTRRPVVFMSDAGGSSVANSSSYQGSRGQSRWTQQSAGRTVVCAPAILATASGPFVCGSTFQHPTFATLCSLQLIYNFKTGLKTNGPSP